jgi:ABC-type Fe3+ transport system permease subunit
LLLAVAAVALPPFLVTNCWLDVLGPDGPWRRWWPFNLYSTGGAAWILSLLAWPIALLAVLAAWHRVQPSQLECDPLLRGGALLRWLLWPMARTATAQAGVLIFVLALNNFTVPTLLQVKVFPAEVWLRFSTHFDHAGALALSWPLVVAPLLLLLLLRRADLQWPRAEGDVTARAWRRQLGLGWHWACGGGTLFLLALSLGLPLAELAGAARTWMELPGVLRTAPGAVWNSFRLGAATATLCLGLGLATWRWPWGWPLWLPLLVPGVLVGMGMIRLFNRPGLEAVYQSAAVMLAALVVRYLAIGWNGAAHALRSVDRDLVEAIRLEGASTVQTLRWVQAPLAARSLAAAWYLTYLLCLWDVETVVLIVPPGGETLALRIFNLLHYGHSAQVNALCVALLALALAPLVLWTMGQWMLGRRHVQAPL